MGVEKKMRLIDADKLMKSLDTKESVWVGLVLSELIANTATVKAIPIDWIEDWQYRHEWQYESYFSMRDGIPKYAIECMLEDWERENADTD